MIGVKGEGSGDGWLFQTILDCLQTVTVIMVPLSAQ